MILAISIHSVLTDHPWFSGFKFSEAELSESFRACSKKVGYSCSSHRGRHVSTHREVQIRARPRSRLEDGRATPPCRENRQRAQDCGSSEGYPSPVSGFAPNRGLSIQGQSPRITKGQHNLAQNNPFVFVLYSCLTSDCLFFVYLCLLRNFMTIPCHMTKNWT